MWSVEEDKLHMTLVQRSGDFFVAAGPGCWNEVQYAFLQCLIAQCCGLKAGNFLHIVQDLHVYDRHLTANKQIINEWLLLTPIKEEDGKPARSSNEKVKYEPYIDFVEYEGPALYFSERIENKEKSLKKAWKLFNSFNQNEYEIINYKPKDTKLKLEVAI